MTGLACLVAGTLSLSELEAQQPAPPKPPVARPKPAQPKPAAGAKQPNQPAAPPANARAARGPLTKADIERLWKGSGDLLMNEIRLRGVGFEPEEEWLTQLGRSTQPAAAVELDKLVAPAPTPEAVAGVAADLLNRIKIAAQKRDEEALKPLLHPELMAPLPPGAAPGTATGKAKVYDLFDTANYQNHALGRFSPASNRRVGVQFFQLTNSQVERLHYVQFASSKGEIVVRDIVTGPKVADTFLTDEKSLALSKLDLVFRAFNDGDEAGLRNLCTQGLFDKMKDYSNGARFTRGMKLTLDTIKPVVSVDLDHKSIRVVTRVNYNTTSGRKIEFDIDFERIGNDLRVVRLRDTANKVIVWDPNIDNYLNRRFGLPDGPPIDFPPQGMTELVYFKPLSTIRQLVEGALYAGDIPKLHEYSQELTESLPASGEGQGVRAGVNLLLGKFDEARQDALTTLDRGGIVYFAALRHKALDEKKLLPVVLGITKGKIIYKPVGGDSSEPTEYEITAIRKIAFDPQSRMAERLLGKKGFRPLLDITVKGSDGKDRDMNFAAYGTSCKPGPNLAAYGEGDSACGTPEILRDKNKQPVVPTYVGASWRQNLQVIQGAIEEARKRAGK